MNLMPLLVEFDLCNSGWQAGERHRERERERERERARYLPASGKQGIFLEGVACYKDSMAPIT